MIYSFSCLEYKTYFREATVKIFSRNTFLEAHRLYPQKLFFFLLFYAFLHAYMRIKNTWVRHVCPSAPPYVSPRYQWTV